VTIASGASPLVVSNDVSGLSIKTLTLSGSSAVTLVGNAITLTGTAAAFANSVTATVNAPVTLSTTGAVLKPAATVTFNGTITLPSSGKATLNGTAGPVYFRAPISGPNCEFIFDQEAGNVFFYAPVDLKNVKCTLYKAPYYYFYASGNKIPGGINLWYRKVCLSVPNAFDPSTPLLFPESAYREDNTANSTYFLQGGYDQVANYIKSGKPLYNGDNTKWRNADHIYAENAAVTLTLKATQSARTYANLKGALSLVYDPQGNYVQTFLDRIHATTGNITVKGGTLRMDGTNYFSSVKAVTVADGATFEVATTNARALAATAKLALGDGARFLVVPTATSLFGTTATHASVRSSSRFVLPSGSEVTVNELVVDGVPVAAGSYSQTADSTRAALAQVEGAGTLVVSSTPSGTWWTGANGTDWGDAGNWSAGVPAVGNPAHIEKTGNVDVHISAGSATSVGALTVENAAGTTTLTVASDVSFSGGELTVGKGSTMTVNSGVTVIWDGTGVASSDSAPSVNIHDGGMVSVEGGTLHFTNTTGRVAIGGGSDSSPGTLRITSGVCDVYKSSGNGLALLKGGLLKMTGGDFVFNHAPVQTGGIIDCSGNAKIEVDFVTHGNLFLTGTLRFAGSSKIFWTKKPNFSVWGRFFFTPNADGETNLVEVLDSASLDFSQADQIYIGTSAGRSILYANTTGKVAFGNAGAVGVDKARGEFVLSNGVTTVNKYSFYVGGITSGSVVDANPEGTMRMYGGTFTMGSRDITDRIEGFTIGDGQWCGGNYTRCHPTGLLELSAGSMNVGTWLIAGIGGGTGTIRQSGGTLSATHATRMTIIGLKGGHGLYEITGGSFSNQSGVYVGGCYTNLMGVMQKGIRDGLPGYGTLSVSGGTFSTTKDIYVGLDGHGAVNVGTGGVVTARNLYLTNSYDTVAGETVAGALSFTPGATTSGRVNLSGTLYVAPGATLNVDATGYEGKSKVTLLQCAAGRSMGDWSAGTGSRAMAWWR
jgi:hypothetical protein